MADFKILGPVEVEDGGRRVDLGGTRQRALLAILLLHRGEAVSAERLIDKLYSGNPPPTAGKSLQAHVSRLRKALGGDGRVRTEAGGYALSLAPGELDADRFAALLSEARRTADRDAEAALQTLDRALALWRGPPLGDLAYEDFAQVELSRLEELHASCVEERVGAVLALGRHADLLPELERLVAEHPLRERLRGQQMVALYRCGRQAEALDAYQDARRALVDELGLEPGRALQELERGILNHDVSLDPPTTHEPPTTEALAGRLAVGAFVGRTQELSILDAALADARTGRGRLVLLSGEAGIGKSRLADELTAVAKQRGMRVVWGRCWEAGGAPAYWPWVQALRSCVRELPRSELRERLGRDAADLRQLLPELGELFPDLEEAPPIGSDGDRFSLFEATAGFLRAMARHHPLLVVLDDVHAADPSSLLLLEFVASGLAEAPLLVLACYRDPELEPGHPASAALARIGRHASRQIRLGGLYEPEVASFIELTVQMRPPLEVIKAIAVETEGNPLFVGEIVRLLAAEGRLLDRPDASWPPSIPETVKEVIGRRLARLAPGCLEMLELASVIGREFDLELLVRLSGRAELEVIKQLDEAIAARLVADVPGAPRRRRFTHALIRDTLYDALPRSRRLELHRGTCDALEALVTTDPGAHLAELAHHSFHALPALDAEVAIGHARRAASHAQAMLAHEEAARLYESALQASMSLSTPDPALERSLLLGLGDALARGGEMPGARDAFLRAAALARATGSPEDLAAAALGYGGRIVWTRAAGDRLMISLLEEALVALGDVISPWRARLLARLAGALRDERDPERRIELAELAVSIARRTGDAAALAYAFSGLCAGLQASPDMDRRFAITAELKELAELVDDKEARFDVFLTEGLMHFELGRYDLVRQTAAGQRALAEELRQPAQLWAAGAMDALLALHECRLDDAETLIEQTLMLGRRAQRSEAEAVYALQLYELRREQGRAAETYELLAKAASDTPARPVFRCALARLASELGRDAEARRLFEEVAANEFFVVPRDQEFLLSLSFLAETCIALGDERRATELYALLLPYADRMATDIHEGSAGAVGRLLGLLATMLGLYEEARLHFDVGIALNEATEAHGWAAHTRCDLAELLLRADDRGAAQPLLDVAAESARRLGMVVLAARVEELFARVES